ncbi:hypothetical protein CBR_g37040 [Chara braunii]|uniref:Uncharacterized protein n=1 Tax=Chara braunii TaxID=69332 RepID=A0A388LLZ9_CHABU|nr:hypothetical protein CBR_g37040 [Chara braunii]|eukprot:GBG83327.1 hypothetical protein CBR_g37040 [Chara braunii]
MFRSCFTRKNPTGRVMWYEKSYARLIRTAGIPPKEFFPRGWWDELTCKYEWLKEQPWSSKPAQALIATLKPEILDGMKRMVETGDFPNFFCMIGFSDVANLACVWDLGKDAFVAKLLDTAVCLEKKKTNYEKECLELPARTAKVEQMFVKIWGLDHSHLQGQAAATPAVGCTIAGALTMDDKEMAELNAAIAAVTATASCTPEKASSSQGRQYTAFAPLPSLHEVEHTSTGFTHALWKLDTFNHLAPFSVMGERSATWLEDVVIGWRYGEALGAEVCKPVRVFRKFRMNGWEARYVPEFCQYGTGRHAEFPNTVTIKMLPEEGTLHVFTNDTGIMNNGQLQLMLNAGLNHIPLRSLDEEFTMDEVEVALDKILTTQRCDEELSLGEDRQVKVIVRENAMKFIRNFRTKRMHILGEPINSMAVRGEIEWLTSRYGTPTPAPHDGVQGGQAILQMDYEHDGFGALPGSRRLRVSAEAPGRVCSGPLHK